MTSRYSATVRESPLPGCSWMTLYQVMLGNVCIHATVSALSEADVRAAVARWQAPPIPCKSLPGNAHYRAGRPSAAAKAKQEDDDES